MTARIILISLLSALFVLLPSTGYSRTLTACGHPFYPPVSWINNKQQLTGLAPAVTQQLFAELGYRVTLRSGYNWKRCLLEVQQGNADIIVAAYHIPSRDAYLWFSSQPVIVDQITLFVNRQKPLAYQTLDDLKGKVAGLLLGDSFGEGLDQFLWHNTRIEYVSRNRQNFQKLAQQKIDFMPVGLLSGNLQSRKLGFYEQVMPLNDKITTELYFLAVGKHSGLQPHLTFLNRRLQEMHQDGSIKRLTEQYSLQYLDQTTAEPDQ
ncbi:transporter substrate-binding domain-containing protein [Amphritea sp. 1_MG-2023]|uniref:substrate-binding periplasmic protein n=1 Tax=Amphritea sp. 1_MG-2023 TaxID=3062670 RepID=UPI0026E2C638|nr:transporter substrate-binding domain-containing protein [Amphritea sp. 1_MG-2023]MDO6561928.1 transporter substrate-binding domain-containing protein [Amphritea sp. 1_MG-2023]